MRPITPTFIVLFLNAAHSAHAADLPEPERHPVPAEQSLRHLRVAPGLKIELVAAEPQVVDPIAVRFDEDGRMWVVELRDYPSGPEASGPAASRIRVLTDRDGDGHYETARTFADELLFPTGIQPWRGGLIVTLNGQIDYLKDTDDDGRADLRETWFTGFAQQNPQLRASHPTLALDSHVYVTGGLRGGNVVDARTPGSPGVSLRARDFRFDPKGSTSESVSGGAQFGLTFDDFGRRFYCSNRNPLVHVVLEQHYAGRSPHLGLPALVHNVARIGPHSRVYPVTRAWTTSTLHAGQITSACGVHLHRGDGLPAEFYQNAFVCETTGNLVRREVIAPRGATFVSQPARKGIEFLVSSDEWFRPVFLETGPDGGLYVVDMHRAVIEHPDWMPEELRRRKDLLDGTAQGRIYRIVAADKSDAVTTPRPRLSEETLEGLVERLEHPNAWWRETAARLLLERGDRSVKGPLERVAGHAARPASRALALGLLAGLKVLDEPVILRGLGDSEPPLREHAVRLAEGRLVTSAALKDAVLALAGDADPRVRFQVALTAGELPTDAILPSLASIALAGAEDPWTQRAVGCSAGGRAGELLARILEMAASRRTASDAGLLGLVDQLATQAGAAKEPAQIQLVLQAATARESEAQAAIARAAILSVAQGLARRGESLAERIDQWTDADLRQQVRRTMDGCAAAAINPQLDQAQREQAIEVLRYHRAPTAVDVLLQIASGEPAVTLRMRAIGALTGHDDERIGRSLVEGFPEQSPSVRRAILDVLISRPATANRLLDEVAAGRIRAAEIDPVRTKKLLAHSDALVRRQAKGLLESAVAKDRGKIVQQYREALKLRGNPDTGRQIFEKNCASCHRVADVGVDIGPDIADSRVKTHEQLLVDILNPNQAIDANYIGYSVITRSGKTLSGIISAETPTSVTIGQQEGRRTTLLKEDLETIRSSGLSLMPEGLEKNMTKQQMADLLAFIKHWRYLDGRIPLDLE